MASQEVGDGFKRLKLSVVGSEKVLLKDGETCAAGEEKEESETTSANKVSESDEKASSK